MISSFPSDNFPSVQGAKEGDSIDCAHQKKNHHVVFSVLTFPQHKIGCHKVKGMRVSVDLGKIISRMKKSGRRKSVSTH